MYRSCQVRMGKVLPLQRNRMRLVPRGTIDKRQVLDNKRERGDSR